MSKNKFRKEEEPKQEQEQESKPVLEKNPGNGKNKKTGGIRSFFDGTILTRKFMIRSIPIIFLVFFLLIILVANRYVIEKTSLEIRRVKTQIDELQMRHTQTKGEYMRAQKITEIVKRIDTTGVKESTSQPKKIVIKE